MIESRMFLLLGEIVEVKREAIRGRTRQYRYATHATIMTERMLIVEKKR